MQTECVCTENRSGKLENRDQHFTLLLLSIYPLSGAVLIFLRSRKARRHVLPPFELEKGIRQHLDAMPTPTAMPTDREMMAHTEMPTDGAARFLPLDSADPQSDKDLQSRDDEDDEVSPAEIRRSENSIVSTSIEVSEKFNIHISGLHYRRIDDLFRRGIDNRDMAPPTELP